MKNVKFLSLILCILFTISCDKEVEIVQNVTVLEDFGIIDDEDSFVLSADKDTLLVTENGIGVFINGNSFIDEQGNLISGEIELEIKDVTKLSEIFAENISTLCSEGMLETRGMLEISAYSGDKSLRLLDGKAIDLFFPGDSLEYTDAEIYYGYENSDGVIKWIKGEKQELRNDPINWDEKILLDFYTSTDWKYNDLVENMGFFQQQTGITDSLSNWIDLSNSEKKLIAENRLSVRWTLFGDGDFEVYYIEGDVPNRLKKKVENRLNNIPSIAAFHREGGAAQVSGSMTITAHFIENEILNNFSLRTYELGWVNCDIFIRSDAPLVNMVVDAPNSKTLMKLIFDDYRTVVSGVLKSDGKVYFEGVAEGANARLVTIYPDGDKAQLSISKIIIQKQIETPNDFMQVGKSELEKILDNMI